MRFLLVDDILELDPGRTIRAVASLPPDDELFLDHFPGFPVVPGVLLTEMMGQAAGQCLRAGDPAGGRPILAQIKSAIFREWVRPGDTIVLQARIGTRRPEFATATCRAEVQGRPVASAELMFTFLAPTALAANPRDPLLERFLARSIPPPDAGPTPAAPDSPAS